MLFTSDDVAVNLLSDKIHQNVLRLNKSVLPVLFYVIMFYVLCFSFSFHKRQQAFIRPPSVMTEAKT